MEKRFGFKLWIQPQMDMLTVERWITHSKFSNVGPMTGLFSFQNGDSRKYFV